ncbi:MAG: hydrogenase maturation protease [Methanoregula sp.]|jgi:hydrogenase 3 maturation protease
MNRPSSHNLAAGLRRRLKGACRIAVVGIGDELSPFDRFGMVAAKEIKKMDLPGIKVFLAGTMPESITGPIRTLHPDHVILLDAAEIGARPGTIEIIKPGTISAGLFSTHALPLSVVMEYMEKNADTKVTLLGIQPDTSRPDKGLSPAGEDYFQTNLKSLLGILRDICSGITP